MIYLILAFLFCCVSKLNPPLINPMQKSPNIITFFGSDEGKVSSKAQAYFDHIKPSDELNCEIISGQADDSEQALNICLKVIEAIQTVSFFGDHKVIYLKQINFLGGNVLGESLATLEGLAQLTPYLEQFPETGVTIIISATQIDKRKSFYKLLSKIGDVHTYDAIDMSRDGWERNISPLIRKKVAQKNLKFTPDALDLFILLIGNQTRQIDVEIEKISLYLSSHVDKSTITKEIIETLVPLTRAGIVFEISRALEKQNFKKAWKLVEEQLNQLKSPIEIIRAAIIPCVRNLYYADLIKREINIASDYKQFQAQLETAPKSIQQILPRNKKGVVSAYPLFLASQNINSNANYLENLHACAQTDRLLVHSNQDSKLLLQQLIIKLTR